MFKSCSENSNDGNNFKKYSLSWNQETIIYTLIYNKLEANAVYNTLGRATNNAQETA